MGFSQSAEDHDKVWEFGKEDGQGLVLEAKINGDIQ
jgi:hypothetical protein